MNNQVKIDSVPKPFVFTNHALGQIKERTRIEDIMAHLGTRSSQYEVTTGLSTTFNRKLEATTYLRHTGSNVILVIVHEAEAHIVLTGYTLSDCAKRLKGKKWQSFNSFEWVYA